MHYLTARCLPPLRAPATAADPASVVDISLASRAGGYTTGAVLVVDGGRSV